jgi:hypothetical protein
MRTWVSKFRLKEGAEYCRGLDLVADNRFIGVCGCIFCCLFKSIPLPRVCRIGVGETVRRSQPPARASFANATALLLSFSPQPASRVDDRLSEILTDQCGRSPTHAHIRTHAAILNLSITGISFTNTCMTPMAQFCLTSVYYKSSW